MRDLADRLVCVNERDQFVSDCGQVFHTNQIVFIKNTLKLMCKFPFRASKYLLIGVSCEGLKALCLVYLSEVFATSL